MKARLPLIILIAFVMLGFAGAGLIHSYVNHSLAIVYWGDVDLSDNTDYQEFTAYVADDTVTVDHLSVLSLDPLVMHYQMTMPREHQFPYPYDTREADTNTGPFLGYCFMIGFGIVGGALSGAAAFGGGVESKEEDKRQ